MFCDEAKELSDFYLKNILTDEYRRKFIWYLDRNRPDIADKVRAMVKTDLVRTIDPKAQRPDR